MSPTSLRVILSRVLDVMLRRRRDERLSEEIQGHLDHLSAEYVARGLPLAEAQDAARRAFGGVDQVKSAYRDQRGLPFVDSLVQDARFAVRLLVKDRWFTATAIVALALGIGATTTVFTIVNGMNLSALPVDEPDRIMFLQTQDVRSRQQAGSSYADFVDWQESTRTFSGVAAFTGATMNVGDEERPADRLGGTFISVTGFSVLQVRPLLGRDFAAEDDRVGAAPVVILAYGIWRDRYVSDPTVLGRIIRVNSVPTTVIGVMPEGFRFPVLADLWQPLALAPGLSRDRRDARTLGVFGRLADGVSLAGARAELASIAVALAAQHPETNENVASSIVPFTVQFSGRLTDPPPILMLSAVAFVLLIACANAANLLLARSAYRAREIALRAAMGASRGRIVRQLLVESLMLSSVAGVLGLALSLAGVRLFTSETADFNLPYWMDFSVDARVFGFLAAVCLVTGVACGLAPAWQLARVSPHDVLKEGGRSVTGSVHARRWTSALLVTEVALTLVLLVGAGLLLRTAAALYDADLVIDASNVLAARLTLPPAKFAAPDDRRGFYTRLQERLDANPTVAAATIGSAMPFLGATARQLTLDSEPTPPERARTVQMVAVSDRYFETLRVPILRGRPFAEGDARPGQEAAIVNERFVAQYFSTGDPIGRRIRLAETGAHQTALSWLTIVGVSRTIRHSQNGQAVPAVYVPLAHQPPSNAALVVRGRAEGRALGAVLRQEVHAIDADVAVYNIVPLERISQVSRWIPRAMSTALTVVAAIALVLATMGLYAVTAYGVAQRTSEVGIRTALGARRAQVSWLFLRSTLLQLAAGLTIGLAGAVALGQLLRGFLVQTSPLDPLTFGATVIGLVTVAIIACLVPAQRASRLDPVAALRHE